MQILKKILFALSLAAFLAPLGALADEDTDVQAAARAAMQQKMREMTGQTPAAPAQAETPPATNQIKQTPPPQVAPAKRPATAPRPVFPAAGRPTAPAVQPAPARPAPVQPAYTPTPQPAPAAVVTPPSRPADEVVTPSSDSDIERARAAMRAKMMELEAQKSGAAVTRQPTQGQPEYQPAPGTAPVAKQSKFQPERSKELKNAPEAPVTFAPLEGPASNLPASKEQRLQKLLDDYRADRITAEQYHDERAKILNEK